MNKILSLVFAAVLLLVSEATYAVTVKQVSAGQDSQAWLVEDHTVPVISMHFMFKNAGSITDPQDKAGRAALAMRLLLEGTAQKDHFAFAKALEEKAIYIDSGATKDYAYVTVQTLSEHKDSAFALLHEMLTQPEFSEEAIQRVKKQTKARLYKMQESPEYLASRAFAESVYAGHPYALPTSGTPESIDAITRDDLVMFHQSFLVRDNVIIGVAGDVSHKQLGRLLDHALNDLPSTAKTVNVDRHMITASGAWKEIEKDLPQTVVMFGNQGIYRDDPNFYAAYVLNHIVGGNGLTSRLSQVVRKEKGLTYYIGTDLNPSQYAASFSGMFATKSNDVDVAISAMEDTITAIANDGVTQAELDDAIAYITGSFPLRLDRTGAIASYLVSMQLYELGVDYLNQRNNIFRLVTLQQVNEVAKTLLVPKAMTIVTVGPVKQKNASTHTVPKKEDVSTDE